MALDNLFEILELNVVFLLLLSAESILSFKLIISDVMPFVFYEGKPPMPIISESLSLLLEV